MGSRGASSTLGKTTQEQSRQIEKLKRNLKVGDSGTNKFGGDRSKIIEAPTFSMNKDGSISYRIVGERIIHAEKSQTIGVGDTPEQRRVTISTGKIMKDGYIKRNGNEVKDTIIKKTRKKREKNDKL